MHFLLAAWCFSFLASYSLELSAVVLLNVLQHQTKEAKKIRRAAEFADKEMNMIFFSKLVNSPVSQYYKVLCSVFDVWQAFNFMNPLHFRYTKFG